VLRYDLPEDRETVAYGGRTVPLVDLVRGIGLANSGGLAPDHARRTRAVIFSLQTQWVAATVDAIFEVATVDAATVRPLPLFMSDVWSDLPGAPWTAAARGVLTRADHAVVVLDIARVMRTLFELDQAARVSVPVASL
jgi:chemotaxis signal transduction protein